MDESRVYVYSEIDEGADSVGSVTARSGTDTNLPYLQGDAPWQSKDNFILIS